MDGIQARLDSIFGLIVRDDLSAAVDILNTIEPLPGDPKNKDEARQAQAILRR
jgi:hypothetical protein